MCRRIKQSMQQWTITTKKDHHYYDVREIAAIRHRNLTLSERLTYMQLTIERKFCIIFEAHQYKITLFFNSLTFLVYNVLWKLAICNCWSELLICPLQYCKWCIPGPTNDIKATISDAPLNKQFCCFSNDYYLCSRYRPLHWRQMQKWRQLPAPRRNVLVHL